MDGARRRGSLRDPPAPVLRETHVSLVLLLDDLAVKLKKPVQFEFLDFSTRERRERACHREVELNRRLAPDVYLGVADVLGPDGRPCDHLVVMRRMPDDRRLATLARHGAVDPAALSDLARLLARFHARAERSPQISAEARVAAVQARWEAGFAEIAPFVGSVLDPRTEHDVERLARRYLAGREALFDARIADGRACDGHGDLLADDVFLLPDGPQVLDCLEFDDHLRYGDALADVAFLAMDLERLGAPALAAELLAAYRELTDDRAPESLVHHYVAFRAHIRAKVACLRSAQGHGETAGQAAAEARSLLTLCAEHLRHGRIVLALVGGSPGTGKSTIAAGIAERRGWTVLRSDEVRKDLVGLAPGEHAPAPFGEGIYDARTTDATYAELLGRAGALLQHGESVVLDASWGSARYRQDAAALADEVTADLVELRGAAPPEVVEARIAARARVGTDASDATAAIARELASHADAWPSAVTVDTSGPVEHTLTTALAAIDAIDAIEAIER